MTIEETAHDRYNRYHLPAVLLRRQRLASGEDPMQAYFAIMEQNPG